MRMSGCDIVALGFIAVALLCGLLMAQNERAMDRCMETHSHDTCAYTLR